MRETINEAEVAEVLQQLWRLRLGLRQQQQVASEVAARQQARHRAQVGVAVQRHLYRVDHTR